MDDGDRAMSIVSKIESWKEYPNALGSEARAAVLVGEVSNALGEEIPAEVAAALKKLSLRGTMRDIAQAIGRGEERNIRVPSFHDVVDAGAAASGLSWTESISIITRYLGSASQRLN